VTRLVWLLRVGAALALRPALWRVSLRQIGRLAPPGWWRRPPFLPVPDEDYLRFRLQTAYGDPTQLPPVDDVLTYLHWCKEWPAAH